MKSIFATWIRLQQERAVRHVARVLAARSRYTTATKRFASDISPIPAPRSL